MTIPFCDYELIKTIRSNSLIIGVQSKDTNIQKPEKGIQLKI